MVLTVLFQFTQHVVQLHGEVPIRGVGVVFAVRVLGSRITGVHIVGVIDVVVHLFARQICIDVARHD